MRRNTSDDFWRLVDKSGGPESCWPWTGRTVTKRDGRRGVFDHDGTWDYAHRYAFFLTFDRWPEPQANHHCDNPPCCNTGPGHVYEGTQAENVRDRDNRQRRDVQGARHPNALLTDEAIRAIRAEPRTHGYRQRLAARYDVKPDTISKIVAGINWSHIEVAP